jgi:hypothetical protein
MDENGIDEAVVPEATRLGVQDGLLFRRLSRTSWAHLGGFGRGRGWAGIVQVDARCDPLVELLPSVPGSLTRVEHQPAVPVLGPLRRSGTPARLG